MSILAPCGLCPSIGRVMRMSGSGECRTGNAGPILLRAGILVNKYKRSRYSFERVFFITVSINQSIKFINVA